MSNKKLGNSFESELCERLAEEGFWCHNLAQNAAGQPADVIAVRNGEAFLIDCKVCSRGKFLFSRIEDNQEWAMELWRDCGNDYGWFALKFDEDVIYMVDIESMQNARSCRSALTQEMAEMYGYSLEDWLVNRL